MKYTEEQKRGHVKELQTYLYHIAQKDPRIPPVAPDGIYDAETEAAVSAFQRHYGLPVTGEVDRGTWDAIIREYREDFGDKPLPVNAFPSPDYVIRSGDTGVLVLQLQLMLWALSDEYTNIPEPEQNGVYGPKTERSVRELQRVSRLPQTGEVDKRTWNPLAQWFAVKTQRRL